MTAKTVARDLLAAAEFLNEHGWCRNEFYNAKGQACLAGAVGVVTGALAPVPAPKRRKMIRATFQTITDEELADALAGKGPYADVHAWDWTKSKTARARHGEAVRALAAQIDAEKMAQLLAEYDGYTKTLVDSEWFRQLPPKEQKERLAGRAFNRSIVAQDIVTMFNDRNEHTEPKAEGAKPTVKRTTKAQAVKLLQRAAAA